MESFVASTDTNVWVGPPPIWAGPKWLWSSGFPHNATLSIPTRHSPEYSQYCSPTVLLASSLLYLATVKTLYSWMASREAFTCRGVMMVYNVVQICLCGYMAVGITSHLMDVAPVWEPIEGIRLPNVFGFNMKITKEGEYFIFVHYLSKFLDLLDTVFICLKKKDAQLSFLHVYHHATIGQIWGFLLYIGWGGGAALFGANINSCIHVVMYTHYLMGTLKINNPFKKYITTLQICQFYLCIAQAACVAAHVFENVIPQMLALIQVFYHISMVVLFSAFYKSSYKAKADSVKKSS